MPAFASYLLRIAVVQNMDAAVVESVEIAALTKHLTAEEPN